MKEVILTQKIFQNQLNVTLFLLESTTFKILIKTHPWD